MHWKLGIPSRNSQNLTFWQHNTTQKKWIGASSNAKRRAFWHIARPSVRRQGKTLHFFKKLDHFCLTFYSGGAGGPSTVFSAARPYGRAALLLPWRGACWVHSPTKTNTGGGTNPRTFVGTPRGCGFHPSHVDGWLIHSSLAADLRFWLDKLTRFDGD